MFCFRGLKNVLESFGSFGCCASNKRGEFSESLGCAQQETNFLSVVLPGQRSAFGLVFPVENVESQSDCAGHDAGEIARGDRGSASIGSIT